MNYEIVSHAKFLRINVNGILSVKEAIDISYTAIGQCYEQNKKGILVDARAVTGNITDMDRFTFSAKISQIYLEFLSKYKHGVSIAMCLNEATADPSKYGENVEKNRFIDVVVFTDIERAARWLESKVPS